MMKLGAKHFARHLKDGDTETIECTLKQNPYKDGFTNLFLKGYRRAWHKHKRSLIACKHSGEGMPIERME